MNNLTQEERQTLIEVVTQVDNALNNLIALGEKNKAKKVKKAKKANSTAIKFSNVVNTRKAVAETHKLINGSDKERFIKQLQVLYVTSHDKFLIQNNGGKYAHINNKYKYIPRFNFNYHLEGKYTLGVFGYKYTTKFLSFDVDMKEDSKEVVNKIIDTLKMDFNLSDDNILITFSGNKGYHVDIFFKNVLDYVSANKIYEYVIYKNELDKSLVEFRPTETQGIKLPLGLHQVTGKKCCVVNNQLEELTDDEIFNVIKIELDNVKLIMDKVNTHIKHYKRKELQKLSEEMGTKKLREFRETIDTLQEEEMDIEIELIKQFNHTERSRMYFETGYIKETTSRHIDMLELIKYLHLIEEYNKEEVIEVVIDIINNTYEKGYTLSSELSREEVIAEMIRISEYALTYNYITRVPEIHFSKEEVNFILLQSSITLQRLAYYVFLHGKKYQRTNGDFYMSYYQLIEYGAGKNRTRLKEQLEELENMGLIELVEQGGYHKGSRTPKSNKYKLLIDIESDEESFKIEDWNKPSEIIELGELVKYFFTAEEVKEKLSSKMYYNNYSMYFSEHTKK